MLPAAKSCEYIYSKKCLGFEVKPAVWPWLRNDTETLSANQNSAL